MTDQERFYCAAVLTAGLLARDNEAPAGPADPEKAAKLMHQVEIAISREFRNVKSAPHIG